MAKYQIFSKQIKTEALKPKPTIDKGDLNGVCNRTACDNKRAVFFNHSTQKHYCPSCAKTINQHNRMGAMELFGHELCTLVKIDE